MIFEAINQAFFVTQFAFDGFGIFEGGGLEWLEAVALKHTAQGLDDVLAQHHGWGQQVAHAFDVLGFSTHAFLVVAKQTLPNNSTSMPEVDFWRDNPSRA